VERDVDRATFLVAGPSGFADVGGSADGTGRVLLAVDKEAMQARPLAPLLGLATIGLGQAVQNIVRPWRTERDTMLRLVASRRIRSQDREVRREFIVWALASPAPSRRLSTIPSTQWCRRPPRRPKPGSGAEIGFGRHHGEGD
jgi:hypothetical protein